jgi:menaquinone-9 beta-reductase
MHSTVYDIAIVGGGLAGLCLAIQAGKAGHNVVLFEKNNYPYHKVCGEYISNESWQFLETLGVPLQDYALPVINTLKVSSPSGQMLQAPLAQGGFGISRYKLDAALCALARNAGVQVLEGTKVENVTFVNNQFFIAVANQQYSAKVVCGTFGKRSNLDVKWQRQQKHTQSYIGVKYHVNYPVPTNEIQLHNFKDGYCGISAIEEGKACLCYLTTAAQLQKAGSIAKMEAQFLQKNKYLKHILTNATFLYTKPLTISQVSFAPKKAVENNVLCIGDAAGLISPLCGNGMSMAMHGSKIAFNAVQQFLQGTINRQQMEATYTHQWQKAFATRLFYGRLIQRFFGGTITTNIFLGLLKKLPKLINWLVAKTHGKPF